MESTSRGSAGLEEREAELTSSLAALQEQRWALSEASYERSVVRSRRGDWEGALVDAKAALAFWPGEVKYLIRAAQACYDNGSLHDAFNLFEQARQAVDHLSPDPATITALAALNRRLRPFEMLPDELLAAIFEHVHQDWEKLPSPLQLLHVCKRWREVAMATPTLWQDTRILRIPGRAITKEARYFPPVRKTYRFGQTEHETGYICSRADGHKHSLVDLCAALSCNTLSYLELEVHDSRDAAELLRRLFATVRASQAHLKNVAFTHTEWSQRQQFSRTSGLPSRFAADCLNFVMLCPNVTDVQLFVGELVKGAEDIMAISDAAVAAPANPSFRRLQLDCFGGFTTSKGAQMRQLFLQRSSNVHSLSLRNVPSHGEQEADKGSAPFALQLVATCAASLKHLEVDGRASIFRSLRERDVKSFPQLKHLRHVTHEHVVDRAIPGDMEGFLLPRLDSVEAPIDVIIAMPTVPPIVVVRFDDQERAEEDCAALAHWLLALDSKISPRSLTLMASHEVVQKDFFDLIVETLTPSCAQMVVCPRLTELRLLHRITCERNSVSIPHSLDPTPLPIPIWREKWEVEADVAGVLQLATERLRLSQDLPPTEDEASVAEPSSTLAAEGTAAPDTTAPERATASGECEALSSVDLEGCYVSVEVWESMKSSATLFKVRPDPDEMVKLPWKKEEMARRKKRKFDFKELF